MKIICPNNPNHTRFSVSAHVVQEWEVDESGNWVETINDCTDVMHRPDSGDYFICCTCGADALVEPTH